MTPYRIIDWPHNCLVQINALQTQCSIFKHVDDSIVLDVYVITLVCILLQESTDSVTDWSRHNGMRISARKTKEMIVCFCRNDNHVASIPPIVIDDNDIEESPQLKY